jgi:hypothetical protein
MRKRITLLIAALMVALTMSFGSVAAFAAPPPCEPGAPGCKTVEGKNDKFTQTQRGNFNQGTQETFVCTEPCPPGQFK